MAITKRAVEVLDCVCERNPDAITSKLDQLIYGMNGSLHAAEQIQRKLFGAMPAEMDSGMNQTVEPPVDTQLNMLQNKVTELQKALESIANAI